MFIVVLSNRIFLYWIITLKVATQMFNKKKDSFYVLPKIMFEMSSHPLKLNIICHALNFTEYSNRLIYSAYLFISQISTICWISCTIFRAEIHK